MRKFKSGYNNVRILEDIVIILTILISKSLYYETYGENKLLIPILIIVIVLFLIRNYFNKVIFYPQVTRLYFLLIVAIFINPDSSIRTSLVFVTSLSIAFLITSSVTFERFANRFYKFIKLLLIVSLFRYVITYFNISSFLPNFESIMEEEYRNFIFFGLLEHNGVLLTSIRNSGLWWEPGAFQLFINIAFLFGIVFNKISKRDYILFLIVILSTLSTTGIAVFVILSFIHFKLKKQLKSFYYYFLISVFTLSLYGLVNFVFTSKFSIEHGSTLSRTNDIILGYEIFKAHPIFGSGMGNTKEQQLFMRTVDYGTGSNGIILLIANMGLLSLILIIPFLSPNYSNSLGKREKYLVSLSLLMLFSTENFTIQLIFSLLLFYGVQPFKLNRTNGLLHD